MQINDPVLLNKIADWRRKSADGTITTDELREAIKTLRANRISAAEAAAKSKSTKGKKAAASISAGDLLTELGNLKL